MSEQLSGYETFVPKDWSLKRIKELTTRVGSGVTPRGGSEVYLNEGVIFIRSQNVRFEGLDLSDPAFIDSRTHRLMYGSKALAFDVLLNITGASIGRCCVLPEGLGEVNVNQHVCTVRLENPNRYDAEFLTCTLASPIGQNQIFRFNAGGNREGLNYEQLRGIEVPWPRPFERQKIARILATLDNLIEKTEALIAKYQAIKQGMMHDLFTRGIDSDGSLRPPQPQAPDLYKQSELGWIPKQWEARPLSQFLDYISYGFTNPMPETQEGPWMVTAANVKGGRIDYESCRHTSRDAYDTLLTKKSRPSIGDILLTKDGSLGRVAIVDKRDICINQSVAVLRPTVGVEARYLKDLLETPFYQQRMIDDAGGSTIKHIYITVVDKMLIPFPSSSDEQKAISSIVATLESQIEMEALSLRKLMQTKSGIMHDLLTGKVRVKLEEAEEISADA